MSSPQPHRVAVLGLDGAYPFELGIPARVFGAADGRYDVVVCSTDGGGIRTNAGFDIIPSHGPEALAAADTVIIASFDAQLLTRELPPAVRNALAGIRPTTRIASICTGSFILAAAGMLDGRTATTHWECTSMFKSWYPQVRLDEGVLFVDDGDVLTSAGAASGIDLCLHLIRSDHGAEIANRAARRCVVAPYREGGQAQYIDRPVPVDPADSTAGTRAWMLDRLGSRLTLASMAAHARMSERTFLRRFRAETGTAPGQWLLGQRITQARRMLESTDATIEGIAASVGFATAASLRQHMRAELGISPQAYRRTFRASRETAAA